MSSTFIMINTCFLILHALRKVKNVKSSSFSPSIESTSSLFYRLNHNNLVNNKL